MNKKIIQQICLSFLLVLTLVCIPVTGVQAQTQKVSIKMENVRMKQVMNEIERQTKFLFGINDDVDVNRLVTVNVTNQSLQAALDQMVKGTDITYQISSSNIKKNRQSSLLTFPELSAISMAPRSSERPLLSGAPQSASAAVPMALSRFRYPPRCLPAIGSQLFGL